MSIGSDAELAAFVRRLLDMADDPKTREKIRAGDLRFKLADVDGRQRTEVKQVAPPQFVTERWVDALPKGTTVVTVGKRTRLTPLARDRLKSRKIRIERAGQ